MPQLLAYCYIATRHQKGEHDLHTRSGARTSYFFIVNSKESTRSRWIAPLHPCMFNNNENLRAPSTAAKKRSDETLSCGAGS